LDRFEERSSVALVAAEDRAALPESKPRKALTQKPKAARAAEELVRLALSQPGALAA
jgi:hypothetical protein